MHNLKYVHNIIEVSQNKQYQVILLNPPVYRFLSEKDTAGDQFKRELMALDQDNENVRFWDFEDLYAAQIHLFRDQVHLNPSGAEKFTQMLNDSINSFTKQCPKDSPDIATATY